MRFLPKMYAPSIFMIPYEKLKAKKIHYLIFDLDNTLGLLEHKKPSEDTMHLLETLSTDFTIIIVSNNFHKRVSAYLEGLPFYFVPFARKPSSKAYRRIREKFQCKKEEMVMIGDQLCTDILGANRYQIFSILVDPLGKKEMKITSISRLLEKKILHKYKRLGILERGKYYE